MLLRIGQPQLSPGRTGDCVSLLQGPAAGEWRRIVQMIDPVTYLVDRPIPEGTSHVSISQGFVGDVFQDNRIDMGDSRKATGFTLVGNHFGTRVINNQISGGYAAFKITACPSETPVVWGWSHAPFLGGEIERNTLEDAEHGGTLGVEHDPRYIKSNFGRTYMTARVDHNIVRWTGPFLRRLAATKSTPEGLIVGYLHSTDPGEFVIRAGQNQLDAPPIGLTVPSLVIHAARYNAQPIVNRQYRLPAVAMAPAS